MALTLPMYDGSGSGTGWNCLTTRPSASMKKPRPKRYMTPVTALSVSVFFSANGLARSWRTMPPLGLDSEAVFLLVFAFGVVGPLERVATMCVLIRVVSEGGGLPLF